MPDSRSSRRVSALPLIVVVLYAFLAGRAEAQRTAPERGERIAARLDPREFGAESLLVVHYGRADGRYEGWDLWAWPEGGEGAAHPFAGETAFGRYAIVPFRTTPARAGLIVRRNGWEEKDIDSDRFVELTRGGVAEVWILSGELEIRRDPAAIDRRYRVVGAFLDDFDAITLASTAQLPEDALKRIRVVDVAAPERRHRIARIEAQPSSGGRVVNRLVLARPVAPESVATLSLAFEGIDGAEDARVFARDVLVDESFTPLDARLGAFCTPEATEFATWSPTASAVELVLYGNEPALVVPLERGERGLWTTRVEGDLHGRPYRYRFDAYGVVRTVPDMHAFAATADSSMTVVVDLDRLRPEGWGTIPQPTLAQPTDEVIYEIHVRDYSIADERCPPELRGTYLGLVQAGDGDDGRAASGLAHLRELGVSAVHLLPIHDFTARVDEYNWGYWTTLFNVPETNYAARKDDPTSAIVELREAIQRLHAAGLRVILDVVYNHTSDAGPDSPFGAAVPYYFFRTTPDGRLVNDTGVGNTFADERPMARKYIVDSVLHWVRNYRVDGFRFDLLGTHEPATVRAVVDALRSERADLTIYGEPWTGGGRIRFGKGAQRGLGIAVFNDHLRNAIRGDLDGTATGFAFGSGGDRAAIRRGVAGAIDDFADGPSETIQYASAHDNLILWDKIEKAAPDASESKRRAMQKLAHGIVLTSQGIAFVHGGCDFARTKFGNHNSYDAGDEINRFDWARKGLYDDVFRYIAGLVRLRREHPVFRLPDAASVRRAIAFVDEARLPPGVVAFTLDGRIARDPWQSVFVAYNGEPTAAQVPLPRGDWRVVVDQTHAGVETLRTARGAIQLPPHSMTVAWRPTER
jgi:pullulanase